MPDENRGKRCPQCGETRWTPSAPQACTFHFGQTGEQEVHRLYCSLCESCRKTFVPVSLEPDDGRPECGRMDMTVSDPVELEFTYPRLGERRRHVVVAMKLKCCGKFVILGANANQKSDLLDLFRWVLPPAQPRAAVPHVLHSPEVLL